MSNHIDPRSWPECDHECADEGGCPHFADTIPSQLPQPTRRTRAQTLIDRVAPMDRADRIVTVGSVVSFVVLVVAALAGWL